MFNRKTKKLLFYIEPHPIRNGFSQFLNKEVRSLIPALINQLPRDYEVRFFGNEATITAIIHDIGGVSPLCLRPTEAERKGIYSYLRQWDKAAICERNDLILGRGKITEFYYSILDRIHRETFDFDCILAWSDNGAVKKYAEDKNLVCLFAELGPTRNPFTPTIYFDHEGTNGFSSVCNIKLEELSPKLAVARRIWSVRGKDTSVYDRPLTLTVDETSDEPVRYVPNKYIFVALQLADDLNTVLCSPYDSPLDFLKQVVDDFKESGYDIVVKGHPGAKDRAYNLKAQHEAQLLAESYEHIHFLDSSVGAVETIDWYVHAEAVISINSSLSFEALLSGKKAFAAGDAVYNLAGLMNYVPGHTYVDAEVSCNLDKASSFLMEHYFQPVDSVFNTDLVYRLFDFYREMKDKGLLGTGDFWKLYTSEFSEGLNSIIPVEFRDDDVQEEEEEDISADELQISLTSLLVNRFYSITNVKNKAQSAEIYFTDEKGKMFKTVVPCDNVFVQCVDTVVGRNNKMYVTGWAFEREKRIPATAILVFCKGKFVSRHRLVVHRRDVREKFGLSNATDYGYRFECEKMGEPKDYSFMLVAENGKGQMVKK